MTDLHDALRILHRQDELLNQLQPLADAFSRSPAAGLAAARRMRRTR